MSTIVFGTDPEGFYTDGRKVIPPAKYRLDFGFPVGYDEQDYGHRHPIFAVAPGNGGDVKLIEDGAAFELTVPPALSMKELMDSIAVGYELARGIAAQFGNSIAIVPTIPFDTEEFRDRSEEFKESLLFGCDPDRDVFEILGLMPEVESVEDALLHPWRYGGGHEHISGVRLFQEKPLPSVQLLAMTVGNLVTAESTQKELDRMRVYRYGRPGRFRIQEYGKLFNNIPWTDVGIEYRTPSNNWTTSPSLAFKMEETIRDLVDRILPSDSLIERIINEFREPTIQAVMSGNSELASQTYKSVMNLI